MKRMICLILALCLLLTGCSGHYPDRAVDGAAWDREWTILGTVLGVEEPGDGLTLSENPVVLSGDATYYAVWTIGEGTQYTNEEGKDATVYDAQLYLLLYGCGDEEQARQAVSDWTEREHQVYDITQTSDLTANAQDYSLLHYRTISDTNPYERGVVAFGVYRSYAVSAELTCAEGFEGDEAEILGRFLQGCHYSAEEG